LRAFRRAGRFAAVHQWSRRREPGLLEDLGAVEQRYRAVLEEGISVTEVARRHGVVRQTVHEWLARYAAEGLGGLADRSSRRRRARIR
jgi:transposase